MNATRYRWILYTIVFVIISTVSIQVYWNYKNYLINKQQFINDVQISLDNAVNTYYTELAKESTLGFSYDSSNDSILQQGFFKNILKKTEGEDIVFNEIDSIKVIAEDVSLFRGIKTDSLLRDQKNKKELVAKQNDTLRIESIKSLSSTIIFSLAKDSLNLKYVDSIFINELDRKNISLKHGLSFKENYKKTLYVNKQYTEDAVLFTSSKSGFLPKNGTLKAHFFNETGIVLKRILLGITLSFILILAVISCLFYLLRIIKKQKQLAEIKNDFISNITHEFKTPIATIGVALESIRDFNIINDKQKTKTYLNLSSEQLSKLNVMVEKLLETATLDSENLNLNKENTNITDTITLLTNKYKIQHKHKTITLIKPSENIIAKIDSFHFENAINTVLDNAIKYGGSSITLYLKQDTISFSVCITDSGTALFNTDTSRIFEKFYRIPKGNTHDVKGFGIGLYYAKKITEKHGGNISMDAKNTETTFKLSFSNG